jgi:hypothetical protein
MEVSCHRHAPAALYLREQTPGTDWKGGCVDLRAAPVTEARIFCLCQESNTGRPFCSQTLYRPSKTSVFKMDPFSELHP